MKTGLKVATVGGGYVAAFAIASIALAVRLATTNTADAQAASGMYAAGDTMLFLGVFFIASLFPTGALLFFMREHRGLWIAFASVAVAIAMTGIAAMLAYALKRETGIAGLAPLRMLAAPLLALGFLMSTFLAPNRFPRLAFLIAAACEATVTAYIAVVWFAPMLRR